MSVVSDGDGLARVMKDYLPDAFVCANDKTAGRLMLRLNEMGIEIPGRVRVVGIDDAKYSSFLHVPLTALRQPCHAIGAAAVWTVIERIEEPSLTAGDVLLGCESIVRKSYGAHSF